jgi:hypothetical protein
LQDIKAWIDPPNWTSVLEESLRKHSQGTGNWIFQHPIYRRWLAKSDIIPQQEPTSAPIQHEVSQRVLSLQGKFRSSSLRVPTKTSKAKPGYGKTVLCATIIEDIKARILRTAQDVSDGSEQNRPMALAFYFFDKQRPETSYPTHAFRAVLTQLLSAHQDDHGLLDLALLLMSRKGSGQLLASDEEVVSLLAFFLRAYPATVLVFDGIDESPDPELFLHTIKETLEAPSWKTVLSSRPNVCIESFTSFETIMLHEQANLEDIKKYLKPEIQKLCDSEYLIQEEPVDDMVDRISQRSSGMFLWAALMINYLRSDALTPEDRHDAIYELELLEGLDAMYARILLHIHGQFPSRKAWANIVKMFQWVACSCRPLCIQELRIALAIMPGTPTTKRRYLTKFKTSILKISGALVEVREDETIKFIHLSVAEFLTKPIDNSSISEKELILRVEPSLAHYALAADCLSYILHDIPPAPLSGSSQVRPESRLLMQKHPFLLYSSQFWVQHIEQAFEPTASPSQQNAQTKPALLAILFSFLSKKATVTVWIEASYLFGLAPGLIQLLQQTKFARVISEAPFVDTLTLFAQDLKQLDTSWGHVLRDAPNEIWEPSIPAFMQSPFWIGTNATTLISMGSKGLEKDVSFPNNVDEAILIASQTSVDGTEIGIIKVWPSR